MTIYEMQKLADKAHKTWSAAAKRAEDYDDSVDARYATEAQIAKHMRLWTEADDLWAGYELLAAQLAEMRAIDDLDTTHADAARGL